MADAFSMLAIVVVSLFLGINLDKVLQTTPLFTIAFIFLGIGTSIYSTIKKAKKSGAKIVNISAGGNRFYKSDFDAIKNNPDILFIVASGNEVFKIDEKSEYKKYNNVKDLDFFELLTITHKNEFKYSFYPCPLAKISTTKDP